METDTEKTDQQAAAQWAKKLLNRDDWVLLDTETTGLNNAEVVQIGIMNHCGETLLDSFVKPTISIPPAASAIHKITDHDVVDAPSFPNIYPILRELIKGKEVIIYNADFDLGILDYCCNLHQLQFFSEGINCDCAMNWYSQWIGDWNDYYQSYRWQKLPGGDHTAIGDCKATLEVIRRMAAG